MPQDRSDLETVMSYMAAHWPSTVKSEWQVGAEDYPKILEQILVDFTKDATKNHRLFRIAGLSGSGKTTQILPAVEAYCKKSKVRPILIAARRFVKYHPYHQEIESFYGTENLRKLTDEFSSIMLFMTVAALTKQGYDIILDVTFLDAKIEAVLLKLLGAGNYQHAIFIIATSPKVTEHFLSTRSWRHSIETEKEFIRATESALDFYAKYAPDTHIIIWSVYHEAPEYDGPIKDALATFHNFSSRTDLPPRDDEERRAAKITYLTKNFE